MCAERRHFSRPGLPRRSIPYIGSVTGFGTERGWWRREGDGNCDKQHGHIAAIGFDRYRKVLEDGMREREGEGEQGDIH